MSKRYLGNIITSNPTNPDEFTASGVWSVAEANAFKSANKWPTGPIASNIDWLVVAGAGGS